MSVRKFLMPIVAGGAALAVASPTTAQHHAAPVSRGYHRSSLEIALEARLQSIQTRIQLLSAEGLMNSEEARDLRQQSRSIERRLIGLNARDVSDVELAIGRLNDRVRFAADNGRSLHVFDREDDERFHEQQSLERDRRSAFQVDRHVAPPVDRWDDPFDRGNEF